MTRWLVRLVLAVTVGLSLAGAASAQTTGYIGKPRDSYTVYVFGDLLATGLWAGMGRAVAGDARFRLDGRVREDSGLARPQLYDWSQALPRILESNRVDIALLFLGANDGRDMTAGDARHTFGGDGWRTAYGAALDRVIAILKDNGTAVYLIGLPAMASPEHDAAAMVIAELQKERAAALGVRYVDLRALLAAPDGSYTDTGPDNTGEITRLRARDGIKFIARGNDRVAAEVMKLVRADVAVADGEMPASEVPPVVEARPGEVVVLAQDELPDPGSVAVAAAGQATAGSAPTRMRTGSPAAALYRDGIWPDPQPGRIDDFSWSGKADRD